VLIACARADRRSIVARALRFAPSPSSDSSVTASIFGIGAALRRCSRRSLGFGGGCSPRSARGDLAVSLTLLSVSRQPIRSRPSCRQADPRGARRARGRRPHASFCRRAVVYTGGPIRGLRAWSCRLRPSPRNQKNLILGDSVAMSIGEASAAFKKYHVWIAERGIATAVSCTASCLRSPKKRPHDGVIAAQNGRATLPSSTPIRR